MIKNKVNLWFTEIGSFDCGQKPWSAMVNIILTLVKSIAKPGSAVVNIILILVKSIVKPGSAMFNIILTLVNSIASAMVGSPDNGQMNGQLGS